MSNIADVSLAIIAATCLIAVAVMLTILVIAWRIAMRIHALLSVADHALPNLVTNLRTVSGRVQDALETVAKTHALLLSGIARLENATRHLIRDVLQPTVASGVGVLAAFREGCRWIRPRARPHRGT
ncbi:MAG TPA: hypothetical protein VKZ50_05870 [bacterium]|nr:hypothetical protein [bacterium]